MRCIGFRNDLRGNHSPSLTGRAGHGVVIFRFVVGLEVTGALDVLTVGVLTGSGVGSRRGECDNN